MATLPSLASSLVIKNVSNKSIHILGIYNLKPNNTIDLYASIPNVTESQILEELRVGDLHNEIYVKRTIEVISYSTPFLLAVDATVAPVYRIVPNLAARNAIPADQRV